MTLWHLRSVLLGWKKDLDLMISKVDDRLSQVLGLGQMFSGLNKCFEYGSLVSNLGIKLNEWFSPNGLVSKNIWRLKNNYVVSIDKGPLSKMVAKSIGCAPLMATLIPQK